MAKDVIGLSFNRKKGIIIVAFKAFGGSLIITLVISYSVIRS